MSSYSDSPHSPPPCPSCGGTRTIRIKRKGFMQTVVLPRLGIFPWECKSCRKAFTCKHRGTARRRRRANNLGIVKLPPSVNGTPMQQVDY